MSDMSSLSDVFKEMEAGFRAYIDLRDAHRLKCTVRPCKRCELWVCRRCGADTESPPDDRDGSIRPALCEACRRVWERARQMQRAVEMIPARFRWAMTHTPEGKALIMSRIPSFGKHARRLVHIVKSRQALVLYGPSGAGKTSTVCALYRWVLDQAMRADATEQMVAEACGAAFVPARDLASARGEYGKEPALVRLAKRASLLVIDDMGAESPGSKQVIEDVVAHRHDHTLVTWVTTGVARDQFQVRYTGGTERRLTESDTWIELSA